MKKVFVFSAVFAVLFLAGSGAFARPVVQHFHRNTVYQSHDRHHLKPMPQVHPHQRHTFGSFFRGINISLNF